MINIGGYTFKTDIINQALTHSSYSKNNYERLEFLGDSILDFIVAKILYNQFNYSEQELTRLRSILVSENNLYKIFDNLNLKNNVKIGKSCKILTNAIKADIIESIIACIYLESGIKECEEFIVDNFDFTIQDHKDYKSQLKEYAEKNKLSYEFKLIKTDGPAHNLEFYSALLINGKEISNAKAKSKLEAEKICAEIALTKLQNKD